MSWTKRELVTNAFEEIGLANYAFDLQPEQMQAGLRRLDNMMATWNSRGLRLGYPLPDSPCGSDLDQDSNITDEAIEAVVGNLGVRIAPMMGKTVSPDTKAAARSAYVALLSRRTNTLEKRIDVNAIPAGQGGKYWRFNSDPFLAQGERGITTGPDDVLEMES
jgi:hypothetical protein